jgi:hypothetical protein
MMKPWKLQSRRLYEKKSNRLTYHVFSASQPADFHGDDVMSDEEKQQEQRGPATRWNGMRRQNQERCRCEQVEREEKREWRLQVQAE